MKRVPSRQSKRSACRPYPDSKNAETLRAPAPEASFERPILRTRSGDLSLEGRTMILEMAILHVKPDMAADFPETFKTAEPIISASVGYIAHELHRCVEDPNRF